MKQEQCTSLPDTVGACLPTSSSDTNQLSLLSGMDMPAKSLENAQQTDGSLACECGKGTLDCLIHPSTPEAWTAFMQASLAKTLALLENRQVYMREPDQVFTAKSCGSLAWYDQSSSSWKTYQQSLVTDWEPYSETWPRWGMTQGGSAYAHPMSERRITETDGSYSLPTPTAAMEAPNKRSNTNGPKNLVEVAQGKWNHFWPTPTVNMVSGGPNHNSPSVMAGKHGLNIAGAVQMWPTPQARDWKGSSGRSLKGQEMDLPTKVKMWPTPTAHNAKETGAKSQMERKTIQLGDLVGGKLNPMWVEWLMNFPIGFTATHDIMGFNSKGHKHAKTKSRNANSTLSALPEITREKEIQRTAGGFDRIQKEEVLQSGVHGRINDSGDSDFGRVEESFHEVSSEEMQRLWDAGEFACSSHGQQPSEQRTRELEDTLRVMPCKVALGTREESNEASEGLPVLRQASEEERAMQHPCESDVSARESVNGSWWDTEPNIGRVANGVEHRVHRLKGLGNAQVPLQAAVAYRLLNG